MLSENADAVLVDVRTEAEWKWVGVTDLSSLGREPVYVAWVHSDGTRNENFVAELQKAGLGPESGPVVFLCRSGNRSIGSAEAATAAGIGPSYNILDGFEGQLDAEKHRVSGGWRVRGLPWVQS